MNQDDLQRLIGLCRERGIRIVTAESCTGGLIGGALTEIAGSSDVFWGGFITYANGAKETALGVTRESLDCYGAVSEEVVEQMLRGASEKSGAELAIAVSGVAGPGGGSPLKPVGTVWIGTSLKDSGLCIREFRFSGSRQDVRTETVRKALEMAEKLILNHSCLDSE